MKAPIKPFIKNIFVILLVFLAISAVFTLFFQPGETIKQISLSQVVESINRGEVKKITVSGNELLIVQQDGQKYAATKETDAPLSQSLANYGADKEKIKALEIETKEKGGFWVWIGPVMTIALPLLLFAFFFFIIFRQARTGAMQALSFTQTRARLFGTDGHPAEKVSFKDVAGLKEAKEELREIVDFLKNPEKFLRLGAKIPKGVLLLGPSGVGKTLLARAVAGESNVPFLSIAASEFVELFVGVGSGRVRSLFQEAKKYKKCIIFIDELDAIGRVRGTGIGGGHDEREQTLNQILVEMDGFETNSGIIVLAATNRGDVLDPALLRPGRFDRKVILDLPDIADREEILKIHCQGKPLAEDVSLKEISQRTPGFSGADLANLVNEAAILAARRNREQIFQQELLESIEKVLLGPERTSHVLSKKEKEIAAYHEAGHALLATLLVGADQVRKISIVARGLAAGYTLKMPSEERKIRTKSEFLSEMAVFLGGYCAELVKFKEITTGASNDLEKASDMARRLVKEYGMSSLGPVSFSERDDMVFLGREISESRNYSEKVAAQIDKEVAKFIKDAQTQAMATLAKNVKLLDKVAQTLIEKETIEKEEFEQLMGRADRKTEPQRSPSL